jgi:hypothetical protein
MWRLLREAAVFGPEVYVPWRSAARCCTVRLLTWARRFQVSGCDARRWMHGWVLTGVMAVYVDDSRIRWRGRQWSHLIADTTEELHAFAARLGLRRAGFHRNPERPWKDHYDIPEAKRQVAIRRGARPITCREAAEMLRAKRLAFREAAGARHTP